MRMQSGNDRCERRTAQRRRHIATREQDALRGEFVEVWRLNRFVTHKSIIAPALIVGYYEYNIWRFFVFAGAAEKRHRSRADREFLQK